MTLKAGTAIVCIAFGATLAYYIGSRISTDALNLAVGVLCGMAASLPVSIGLLVALFRRRGSNSEEQEDVPSPYPASQSYPIPRQQIPQVIVLAPQPGPYPSGYAPFGFPGGNPAQYGDNMLEQAGDVIDGRDWKVIGDDA